MKLTDVQYNFLNAIRRSDLWHIKQSPLHFKYHMEHEQKPTNDLTFGIAVHKAILEYEDFLLSYDIMPKFDRRTKQGKSDYEDYIKRHEHITLVTEEEYEQILEMRQAVYDHPIAKELLTNSKTREEAYTLTDEETGEKVKVKADIITEYQGIPIIVDYKTTQSCQDGAFERSIRKYGYKLQVGMYTEVIEENELQGYKFAFIAQEKTAPYAVRVYWCDDGFIRAGKALYHELLRRYHTCKVNNTWPGYSEVDLLEENYE